MGRPADRAKMTGVTADTPATASQSDQPAEAQATDSTAAATAPRPRVSARLAAIAESATLAVDAKAKALKAAGRPVIGFGAGEPDFPTPDYIVEAAAAAAPRPGQPPLLPRRRAARAARGDRRQDAARLGVRGRRRRRCSSPTAASRRSTRRSPPSSTRATRCCCRRRTGPPTPRRSGWPAACRSRCSPASTRATSSRSSSSRRPGPTRTKALLFCSPSNPTGAVYSPEQTAAIGRWAHEHGIWVLTDEIYEHLTYDDAAFTPIVRAVPELADTTIVLNGVAKTYAMTGWRVGWMISPAGRHEGRDQPAVAPDVQRRQRVAARRGRRPDRRPVGGATRCATAFDRRRRTMVEMLAAIDGVVARRRRARSTPTRASRGVLGRTIRGTAVTTSAELAAADPRARRGRRGARRGVRAERVTCGCRTRSATTTWPRASGGSSACSPRRA